MYQRVGFPNFKSEIFITVDLYHLRRLKTPSGCIQSRLEVTREIREW